MTETRARPGGAGKAGNDPVAALLSPEGMLTAEGERRAAVSDEQLRDLYRMMAVVRRLDEEGLRLQRQGEIGAWGPFTGHEAAEVGAALAMAPTDWIFPYYRGFPMAVCRGIDPGAMMTMFRGLAHYCAWDPYQYRFAPLIIPVATQVPHAVGFAMGCALDGDQTAVLVSFGEGATSTGDWHEAMNFAGVYHAPLVFLCENNQWAISVPIEEQIAGRVSDRAAGYGFPGVRIDGTDVLTVYAVVRAAAERARNGGGPYLIEAQMYRFGAHTTADDPTRYRTEDDAAAWRAKDPIARAEARLRARGAWDDAFATSVRDDAEARASQMRETLLAAVPPDPTAVFDWVFGNQTESLRRERDELGAALAPGGDA
jgi:2-oxoisovalerate dehydrogenase E1 component alpha subunit